MAVRSVLSKTLTQTDVKKRLCLKTKSLRYFRAFEVGKNAQVVKVIDEEGNEWFFTLIIRRGRYRKPVISAGWIEFVKRKQLQMGFKVQLLVEEDDEGTGEVKYKIKLEKPIHLLGKLIYAPHRGA